MGNENRFCAAFDEKREMSEFITVKRKDLRELLVSALNLRRENPIVDHIINDLENNAKRG